MHIIPTVFATTATQFRERFRKVVPLAPTIQIDFMDGTFVKKHSFPRQLLPDLNRYRNTFEAHLMVHSPERYLSLLQHKGFRRAIVHSESQERPMLSRLLDQVEAYDMQPVLAINPDTSLRTLYPFLSRLKRVLCMGITPGAERQSFQQRVYAKIRRLKQHAPSTIIQVDGGVNARTAYFLSKAGADYLNTGSFVANSTHPRQALIQLEKAFTKGKAKT